MSTIAGYLTHARFSLQSEFVALFELPHCEKAVHDVAFHAGALGVGRDRKPPGSSQRATEALEVRAPWMRFVDHLMLVGLPNADVVLQGLSSNCGQRAQRAIGRNPLGSVSTNARLAAWLLISEFAHSKIRGYCAGRVRILKSLGVSSYFSNYAVLLFL